MFFWSRLRLPRVLTCMALLLAALGCTLSCVTPGGLERAAEARERYYNRYTLPQEHPLSIHVESIGHRLLEAQGVAADRMRFRVLRDKEKNAFSMANGAIFISLDLLGMLNSDEEIAMILGHEIGHVEAGHIPEGVVRRTWVNWLMFPLRPLNILAANAYRGMGVAAALGVFSRDDEREADDLAARYMRLAGFDLTCGIEFYHTLGRRRELYDLRFSPILATHPAPAERFLRLTATLDRPPARKHAEASSSAVARCGTVLLEKLDGFILSAPQQPVVVAEDGSIYWVALSLQIIWSDEHKAEYRNGWLYLDDVERVASVRRLDPSETMEVALRRAGELAGDPGLVLLDTNPVRGHNSVRVAWGPTEDITKGTVTRRRLIEFRHWIELAGRIYRISSLIPATNWDAAEPALAALANHLQPLEPNRVPRDGLPLRFSIHQVEEGDTLESLAEQYPDWDVRELTLWNGLEAGQPLRLGSLIKVMDRAPVELN